MSPHRESSAAFVLTWAGLLNFLWPILCIKVNGGPVPTHVTLTVIPAAVLLALVFRHPFRTLGVMPVALTTAFASSFFFGDIVADALFVLANAAFFAATVRCSAAAEHMPLHRWDGLQSLVGLAVFVPSYIYPFDFGFVAVPVYIAANIVYAWLTLFRPFFELCVAPPLWLSYNIRGAGPGLVQIPKTGPVIVLANHACWWDPLFLAKVLPRPITPMMTSKFYDIPGLKLLLKYVFEAIRVPDAAVRRDAPELQQAIAALDAGRVLVIFPEGFLRRRDEQPLRRFGRGVWEVLKARPDTPVIACWIRGNWGAWPSYSGGPPTKNKKFDIRRPITVAASAPEPVPAAELENHLATRFLLMRRVAAMAATVGDAVPAVDALPADESEPRP